MKIEKNEIEFNGGWVYIQMHSGYICAPAPEVTPYGKRTVQPEYALKGKGCYLDNPKETKITLSPASREWIKERFEEYQNKHL